MISKASTFESTLCTQDIVDVILIPPREDPRPTTFFQGGLEDRKNGPLVPRNDFLKMGHTHITYDMTACQIKFQL